MNNFDPEPPRCCVCDARNPAGAACMGTWCGRESGIRKERIRKDQFDPANENHFRLQSRGGAWRYYVRVDRTAEIIEDALDATDETEFGQ